MHPGQSPRRQRGATVVTVALLMLFLLGFMGFAIDFGRAFIVRTELQTAMDSCALAAAQELDAQATSISRATSAGITAGNTNAVHMQSANWAGQGQVTATDIIFRDAGYNVTTSSVNARYAQCQHTQPNVQMWMTTAMGGFIGDATLFPATRNVAARAVATRASAQSTCPIPVALTPKTPGAGPPNYGYAPGEWITLLMSPGAGGPSLAAGGYIGWANLNPDDNGASETERELRGGYCGINGGDPLTEPIGNPGVRASVADAWNARFGIYRGSGGPADLNMQPDYTGYAYTTNNWPSGSNAFSGPTPGGAHLTAANFRTKRTTYASCADETRQMNGPNGCRAIINRNINSFNNVAPPGVAAEDGHHEYGRNRRLVMVPVTNAYPGVVDGFACMLLLQPISLPPADIQLEFVGNAAAVDSPCVANGLPGGNIGPQVPVLVR